MGGCQEFRPAMSRCCTSITTRLEVRLLRLGGSGIVSGAETPRRSNARYVGFSRARVKLASMKSVRCVNWEDDPVQRNDPSYAGGANALSLDEARRTWAANHS